MKVAWYTSGHGFGHISRSSVIIQALVARHDIEALAVTSPRCGFLQKHHKLILREVATDSGVSQKSSLELDITKTLSDLQDLARNKKDDFRREREFLTAFRPDLVVSDIASLPVSVAASMGIPAVIMGNFSWDFIYRYYGKYDRRFFEFADMMAEEYSSAEKTLILPFSCEFAESPRNIYTGLVGRKPSMSRQDCRKKFAFVAEKKYILVSFGAYGLGGTVLPDPGGNAVFVSADARQVQANFKNYTDVYYPDLVRACDYVLTKPGYGIMSECYFAGTPILYTDRGDFPEYEYLVREIENSFASAYIPAAQLQEFCLEDVVLRGKMQNSLGDGNIQVVDELLSVMR